MTTTSEYNWTSWATDNTPVFDCQQEELGTVTEARDGWFKVQVSGAHDYWLPFDTIAEAGADSIRLRITRAEVEERKNDDAAESLTETEVEEATDDLPNSIPVERRYAAEAEYLSQSPRI